MCGFVISHSCGRVLLLKQAALLTLEIIADPDARVDWRDAEPRSLSATLGLLASLFFSDIQNIHTYRETYICTCVHACMYVYVSVI